MNSYQFINWLEQKNQSYAPAAFEKPLVMGVLNVTSDSFYDGGSFLSLDKACDKAFDLIEQGADILDIGGESTRPGAAQVPLETELERTIPVIEKIRKASDICISIDTYKPETMAAAVGAGANIINDIYALQKPGALAMAATLAVPVCLMHMQGDPRTMQHKPSYPQGVMVDVIEFFSERVTSCIAAGMNKQQLILDPGFGFGKLVNDNLQLVHHLDAFKSFNLPLLLGASRKSTIGAVLNKEVSERLIGSISIALYASLKGVGILRTHDVGQTQQALDMLEAICQAK